MNWTFEGKTINSIEDMPEGVFGFIYKVTHIPSGKIYIGKKQLFSKITKKLGKKEIAALTDKRKSKKKVVISEMDWKSYYGSNIEVQKILKEEGEESFVREILCFAKTSKLLTYYETYYLFHYRVLESSCYFNDNILGKFFKADFISGNKESE